MRKKLDKNKSKKKTIFILTFIIVLVCLCTYYFIRSVYVVYAGFAMILTFLCILFLPNKGNNKNDSNNHNEELITVISYFETFINNGCNVYQAFKHLKAYCSLWMKEALDELLNDVDKDKTVKPFTDFADKFTFGLARNLMLSIYQMVDMGENSNELFHFEILFQQISQTQVANQKARKEKSFSMPMLFPLLGAGMITISLTFGILSIMGELVNVL